ncbi:hypothetical protein RND81_04G131200 [Saponaria officinalis]|uniref:Clp R domain-containing protein n=1 Tax=Saponaria officinalis TaxID=3572 RepID=A0AAW1LNL9_SAPOF
MRSQGCTIQQALTAEAAAVVKQAVGLAKRRGHAQVTPLHVAHTMLSVSSGLFRAACLQAHAHPLQCRALELCFNVALNRLPTSTSGPMLGPHSAQIHHPTLANALVAAFKRAQAHQRRGSIENQQQPLLAVKIELDQLIISILDDPSVSRVMREAGFSSTLVKAKVEQAISLDLVSPNSNININSDNSINSNSTIKVNKDCNNIIITNNSNNNIVMEKPRLLEGVRNEDVVRVIESLVNKEGRRNRNMVVVVGECIATMESLVKEVMERVEKNEVHEVLKEVKFVHLSFSSFAHFSREQVENRVNELKSLVKSFCIGDDNKGLIFYLDDLKWANEFRISSSNNNILVEQNQEMRRSYSYSPIEQMIMEIGKMVMSNGESGKLWLLGIATFQTYMKCKSGQPSLELLWGLHPITIPTHSLGLSLILESDAQNPVTNKNTEFNGSGWLKLDGGRGGDRIDDTRSRQSTPCNSGTSNTTLPSWLQQYKDENSKRTFNITSNVQDCRTVKDLCKRWSTVSTSSMQLSQTPTSSPSFERSLSFSPSSSTSNFSYDPTKSQQQQQQQKHSHQSFEPNSFFFNKQLNKDNLQPTLTLNTQERDFNMFNSSNPNSTPTSTSSSDDPNCTRNLYKEYNANNLRSLCNALERKVPRQKDIIFDLASSILQCRSGSCKRKVRLNNDEQLEVNKEDTWLFFQGFDVEAKESIAREIARLIFGSQDKFVSIGLTNYSLKTRAIIDDNNNNNNYNNSLEQCCRNKRLRDEQSCAYIHRFVDEVSRDNQRVFFVEDIEQVDYCSQMGIKKAIERGKLCDYTNGEEISLGDAIIILSCESYSSKSRACSPSTKQKIDVLVEEEDEQMVKSTNTSTSISLDLNISINDVDDDDNNNDNVVESRSMDDIGLLASVDRCIVFKKCI